MFLGAEKLPIIHHLLNVECNILADTMANFVIYLIL